MLHTVWLQACVTAVQANAAAGTPGGMLVADSLSYMRDTIEEQLQQLNADSEQHFIVKVTPLWPQSR
jgi:hypothetical protein